MNTDVLGLILCLAIAFILGIIVGNVLATSKQPEAGLEKVVDTCFPKGVLVKSENMGYICIDPNAIRWDD